MRDYETARTSFSIETLGARILTGSLAGGLNAFVECCEKWADGDRIALEWFGIDGAHKSVSFADLDEQSARFANFLAAGGIAPGDVVAGLLPRIPELLVAILGTWRAGAVYQPLFTAFGPSAIETRVTAASGSHAKLIVTDAVNLPKLDDVPNCPAVLVVGGKAASNDFQTNLAQKSHAFEPVMLEGSDPFVVLFTSGTTGKPKGVRYPLRFLLPVAAYMEDAIDLQPSDSYWNIADPGWAYGMLYAVIGPLLLGHATTFYEGPFTVDSTVRILAKQHITNLAGAPTAYRMMMAAGEAAMAPIAHQLRVANSAGEPLNPEVIRWAARTLHCPLKDHYGQTETGMAVNNHHGLAHEAKEGGAGLPMPGFEVAVLGDDLQRVAENAPGILAINRKTSPLFMFDGYWKAETPSFRGDWYLTGDTMRCDENGFYFFVGRSDDIITSSGYRIGPFDVESAVMEHPAVAEVAVIGKPDPQRTEIVQAFVVLRAGHEGTDQLKADIQQLVRTRLAAHAYPRAIEFVSALPKTPSGKVQRFVLRGKA